MQLSDLDSCCTIPDKIATRQAESYLSEESHDGVTRTEAHHTAEAPCRPLGGSHGGGEPGDLERTRRGGAAAAAPPLQLFM